ncbi:MAG: nitroreductase [Deltaproteobacteria bacterium]|nr:nitroreductase [Deltaproteobacteria bacterium]
MDTAKAMAERWSCRSFRPEAPPREVVEAILSDAARAPSAVNLQPWRVWVAGGEELERLTRSLLRAYREKRVGCSPGGGRIPAASEPRGPASFAGMGKILEARGEDFGSFINEGSCRLYGAPVGVFCFLEAGEPVSRLLDCGIWFAYLLLSAQARGLGTCPVGLLAAYADEVREALFVPDGYSFACAAALGYPHEGDAINDFRTPKLGIDTVEWVL